MAGQDRSTTAEASPKPAPAAVSCKVAEIAREHQRLADLYTADEEAGSSDDRIRRVLDNRRRAVFKAAAGYMATSPEGAVFQINAALALVDLLRSSDIGEREHEQILADVDFMLTSAAVPLGRLHGPGGSFLAPERTALYALGEIPTS